MLPYSVLLLIFGVYMIIDGAVHGSKKSFFGNDFTNEFMDWFGEDAIPSPQKLIFPYSGQYIRLHTEESYINSGTVEIYKNGRWGPVCADYWNILNSHVACRELGFTDGATSDTMMNVDSFIPSNDDAININAMRLNCTGQESSLGQCEEYYATTCLSNFPASVTCQTNKGCPAGWVAGFGKCYKFYSKATSINLAASVCAKDNSSLLTIDSEAESDYLSSIMKSSMLATKQWYTGVTIVRDRESWNKLNFISYVRSASSGYNVQLKSSTARVVFSKWFPGWSQYNNMGAEPSNDGSRNCLTLSDTFLTPDGRYAVVDYFYWMADVCTKMEGINFICQYNIKYETLPDCYTDNGASYRGNVDITDTGAKCQNWAHSSQVNAKTHPNTGLGNHNYCRNPDNKVKPWCWTDTVNNNFMFCKLTSCSDGGIQKTTTAPPTTTTVATSAPTTTTTVASATPTFTKSTTTATSTSPPEINCYTGTGSNYRGNVSVTENGIKCLKWSLSKEVNDLTHPNNGLGDHNYCRNPDYDTKPWCWIDTATKKFMYCNLKECSVTDFSGQSMILPQPISITPFTTTTTTTTTTTAATTTTTTTPSSECYTDNGESYRGYVSATQNGKVCLNWNQSKEINEMTHPNSGLDHNYCRNPDKDIMPWCWVSTERNKYAFCKLPNCDSQVKETSTMKHELTTVTPTQSSDRDVLVALVGSDGLSGTVEITFKGQTGVICDDQWSLADATVICKMLGFSSALRQTEMNFFNYSINNVKFILDDVQCSGYEQSIYDCNKSAWYTNDCQPYKIAGVECLKEKECVSVDFKCKNNHCVDATNVCDGKNDCEDNSDELNCDKPDNTIIALVNGTGPWEGRVQITRSGLTGTVCDDYWDDKAASVVCKQLGYLNGGKAFHKSHFGPGTGLIWLDGVKCTGEEKSLDSCFHMGWAVHECTHVEDAGVNCLINEVEPHKKHSVETQKESSLQANVFENQLTKCGLRPYGNDYLEFSRKGKQMGQFAPNSKNAIHNPSSYKIIGGHYAVQGAYPWLARIHIMLGITPDGSHYGSHHCGAAILNEFWLISAAHCFNNLRASDFRIIVGDFKLKEKDIGEQLFSIEKIILHELYDDNTKNNDIALIKIQTKNMSHGIQFNSYVQPICLPDPTEHIIDGYKCLVAGWGNMKYTDIGEYPNILRAVSLPLINQELCKYLHTKIVEGFFSAQMLCAGYLKGGIDTCDGDSGGPLVCKIKGVYSLIGITSWGRGCAVHNLPGVYTRVSFFIPWIKDKIKD